MLEYLQGEFLHGCFQVPATVLCEKRSKILLFPALRKRLTNYDKNKCRWSIRVSLLDTERGR